MRFWILKIVVFVLLPAISLYLLIQCSPSLTKEAHLGFTEIAADCGINHFYKYRRGAGIAIFDFNNDYLEDIVFAHPTQNKLYKNNGDGTFIEVAKKAKLNQPDGIHCIGVATGDFNNDGYEDVFFTSDKEDPFLLFMNLGNGTFKDISIESGLNDLPIPRNKTATLGDVNLDGFLDIYVGAVVKKRDFDRKKYVGNDSVADIEIVCNQDLLFINDGNMHFDEQAAAYQSINIGCGFSPVFTDPDNDGDLDLMIPNDWGKENVPSKFFRNEYPEKKFTDVSIESGFDHPVYGMGLAIGDYDHDGDLDYYETNIGENKFFENLRDGQLLECAHQKGIADKWMDTTKKEYLLAGWGTHFMDYDNDMYLDLLVGNSKHHGFDSLGKDYLAGPMLDSMPSRLFRNLGNKNFQDISDSIGLFEHDHAMSTINFDYDNDGDLDIVFGTTVHNEGEKGEPTFFHNNLSNSNHWLRVKLIGTTINRNAIGSHITIHVKDKSWIHEIFSGGSGHLSQSSRIAHFGLGVHDIVDSLVIDWLGPDNKNTVLYAIPANQLIVITQGEVAYRTVTCFNGKKDGDETDMDCGGQYCKLCDCTQQYEDTCLDKNLCYYTSLCFEDIDIENKTIARKWNEILLNAIRKDLARPTVHARNLFHFSVAMYDIWALFDEQAVPYLIGNELNGFRSSFKGLPDYQNRDEAIEIAMSYAAFRLLSHRFSNSPGASQSLQDIKGMMTYRGYDIENESLNYRSGDPAALGNYVASELIRYGLQDGSNEANKYENQYYTPKNKALRMDRRSNWTLRHPNKWQPLTLEVFVDQAGNEIPNNTPEFLGAEWGNVLPFALSKEDLKVYKHKETGDHYPVYHDPKGPPRFFENWDGDFANNDYKWNFSLVSIWASHFSSSDETLWDISPASMGNIQHLPANFAEMRTFYKQLEGGDGSMGHPINPSTGEPYTPQIVKRGDFARVLAEFWADGPDSETPPGHWFTLLNYVSDHPECEKKFQGKGEALDELEWDVKAYFLLSGAVHDAAITAWSIKGWYDYIRPVSAIRYMALKGQCSDPNLPNYSKMGIPLVKGYIEQVKAGDPDFPNPKDIGKIKLYTWKGPSYIKFSTVDEAGVGWILAEHWWPYQRPSFVTPPFSGYVSGHSTFSRAAAEVMTMLTGSEFFPGGMAEFAVKKNEFLVFEEGPSQDFSLQWATYRDASDQCSLSRIWGGIHPPADDIPGRKIGITVGQRAFEYGKVFFDKKAKL